MFKAENIFDWFKNVPVVRGHIFTIFGLQRYLETSKMEDGTFCENSDGFWR